MRTYPRPRKTKLWVIGCLDYATPEHIGWTKNEAIGKAVMRFPGEPATWEELQQRWGRYIARAEIAWQQPKPKYGRGRVG